jgi:hypothetical protein
MGNFPAGAGITPNTFVFHTNGTSGPSVSGTFDQDITGFNRMAVSYDPVNHVASASLNGVIVASLPYTLTGAVKYVGAEGSYNANVDNFTVATGAVTDPPPITTTAAKSNFSTTPITSDVLQTAPASVLA